MGPHSISGTANGPRPTCGMASSGFGQAGNQLGATWWSLLKRQQQQLGDGLLSREWFRTTDSNTHEQDKASRPVPRLISVDSEAKVVSEWSNTVAEHQVHILGHGGCGNNWACGYQFGSGMHNQAKPTAWSNSSDASSRIDQVMEGIRRECEVSEGVSDFMMMASLAGGTGSGMGSAILEALADEYPASTVAAVAVAPGHTGDSTIQSINSCLALQHLATYAHAVILIDNQTLLSQLNSQLASSSSSTGTSAKTSSSSGSSSSTTLSKRSAGSSLSKLHPKPTAATTGNSSKDRSTGAVAATASAAARPAVQSITGRACLDGVNQLAADALVGLLWPLNEDDLLMRRSNLRQLASTICADPVTKFVELCHTSQPTTAWTSTGSADPWSSRVRLLSSQLPRYGPYQPAQAVTTSAALLITRGMPGTSTANQSATTCAASASSLAWSDRASNDSCRFSNYWSSCSAMSVGSSCNSSSSSSWQRDLSKAVCSSWPHFNGDAADVHVGSSPALLWSTPKQGEASMTAAVRRSSTGTFMQAAAERALQLCEAGAYMHWYEQYGCLKEMIKEAAYDVADMAEAYLC